MAASSAYRSSNTVSVHTYVWAWSRRRLNMLPSRRYLNGIPTSLDRPFLNTNVTANRNKLNISGAKTSLFDTCKNFKRIWLLAANHDPGLHTVVELPQHGQKVGATFQNRSRFTVSNALVRYTKPKHNLRCCSRWSRRATKIMSIVLQPSLKPRCDSGRTVSIMWIRRRRSITRARTFPATANSDMPRLLPHTALSPFCLYMVTMLTSFHCCGTIPEVQSAVINQCSRHSRK